MGHEWLKIIENMRKRRISKCRFGFKKIEWKIPSHLRDIGNSKKKWFFFEKSVYAGNSPLKVFFFWGGGGGGGGFAAQQREIGF